jgi:hypothetical protein
VGTATGMALLLSSCGTRASGSQAGVWPPSTRADARTLASEWQRGDLKVIRREQGFTGCMCRISVLVPRDLTNRQRASALLKTFYDMGLDTKVDVSLFGYLTAKDLTAKGSEGGMYTAGRILMDDTYGSHSFELDTGDSIGQFGHVYNLH